MSTLMTVHILRKKIIVSCSNQLSPVAVSRRVNVFFIWLLEVASSSKSGKSLLSCQLERAGIGCFAELKLEIMQLLAKVNSCKLTENMASAILL